MPSSEETDIITIAIILPVASGKWHGQIINDSNIYICSTPPRGRVRFIHHELHAEILYEEIYFFTGSEIMSCFCTLKGALHRFTALRLFVEQEETSFNHFFTNKVSDENRCLWKGYYRTCHLCHFQAVSVEMRETFGWLGYDALMISVW